MTDLLHCTTVEQTLLRFPLLCTDPMKKHYSNPSSICTFITYLLLCSQCGGHGIHGNSAAYSKSFCSNCTDSLQLMSATPSHHVTPKRKSTTRMTKPWPEVRRRRFKMYWKWNQRLFMWSTSGEQLRRCRVLLWGNTVTPSVSLCLLIFLCLHPSHSLSHPPCTKTKCTSHQGPPLSLLSLLPSINSPCMNYSQEFRILPTSSR